MEKRTIITSIVISVFLIGIVSAAILPYFGKITGAVTVSAPVFYLSHTSTTINNVSHSSLISNNFDNNFGSASFTGTSNKVFVTEPLNLSYIYPANYNFSLNLCAQNKSVVDLNGQVDLMLKVLHSNGNYGNTICEAQINNISTKNSCTSSNNYMVYPPIYCTSGKIDLVNSDGLILIASDGSHQITYHIKMDGKSKIEVIPQ